LGLLFGLAVGVWLLGSAATAGLLFVRARRFHKFLRLACRDDERLTGRVRQLSYRTGLISYPKVVVVEGVVSPMLWGVGGGVRLLFPAKLMERLDAAETDALLLHELAHYSRGDYWVRLLELATYVAYWWNPIVWWACRQIETAEEQCCDAWVVAHQSGTRRSYAEALLATIDFLNEPAEVRPPAACGLGEVSLLKLRLTQIMRGQLAPQLPRTAWIVVLLVGLALAPLEPALLATSSRSVEPAPAIVVATEIHAPPVSLSPADIAPLLAGESPPPTPVAVAPPAAPSAPPAVVKLPSVFNPSRLYASVFSPDNRFQLEARTGRKTVLMHPNTGWRLDLGNHEVNCVSFSPDSRFFVTGHKDGKLRQWDSETGGLMATLATNAGAITSVAYSPKGAQFAAGTHDGVVSVWNAISQEEVARRTTARGAVSCVRWSPSGDWLAIALGDWSQSDQSRLHIWSPRNSELLSDDPLTDPAGAIDWLSDDVLLIASWDGQAVVRNRRGNSAEQTYQVEKDLVSSANWSSDVQLVPSWVADKLAAGAGL
jgi:beta-lactamase regulating signal transducer with metallopeptidase domain